VPAKKIDRVFAALAARVVGAPRAEVDALRKRLVQLGLSRVPSADGATAETRGPEDFGERVKAVARMLSTPPFEGRVAIAQVYEEYGRHHADARSLASFKERLVTAARARKLDLERIPVMPNQRVLIEDHADRRHLGAVAVPLKLGVMSQTHLQLSSHWAEHFARQSVRSRVARS
jgi:hypothetical protein